MADTKKIINPVAVGAAGAVIGIAAGAAAMALSDKNNRKKVQKTMNDMRVWGDKKMTELKKDSSEAQKDVAGKMQDIKEEIMDEDGTSKKTTTSSRQSAQV